MKIARNGATLLASFALCALLPSCRQEGADLPGARGDTAATAAHANNDTAGAAHTHPATAGDAARPDTTPEPASAPVTSDAHILSRTSLLCGRLSALANVAQGRSRHPDVLAYAGALMSGYGPLLNRVESISSRMGLLPEAPPEDSTEDAIRHALGILREAPDGEVDTIFMAQAVASQRTLLANLKEMEKKAKNPTLRAMIREMIPDVEKYLNEALRIQGKLAAG